LQLSIALVLFVALAVPYVMTKISHNIIQTQTASELHTMRQDIRDFGEATLDIKLTELEIQSENQKLASRIEVIDTSIGQNNLKKVRIDKISKLIAKENFQLSVTELAEFAIAITEYTEEYDVPVSLVMAITKAESNFNARAISPAGAQGAMQLMPMTAEDIRVELNERNYAPFKIKTNVRYGTRYLEKLLRIFKNDVPAAISAYNTGPVLVAKYMSYFHCVTGLEKEEKVTCGRPIELYPETLEYKRKVQDLVEQFQKEGLK
jgi:hypothetical protein